MSESSVFFAGFFSSEPECCHASCVREGRRECRVRKAMGSQVSGSWNKVTADSSLYRVWAAAVGAVCNCVGRVRVLI